MAYTFPFEPFPISPKIFSFSFSFILSQILIVLSSLAVIISFDFVTIISLITEICPPVSNFKKIFF